MSTHRSRLSKHIAEEERLVTLRAQAESAIAQFAAQPLPFSNATTYHAAQTTRARHFSGEGIFGGRPQHEDKMLAPYDRARIISRARIMIRNNPWVSCIFLAYVQEIGTPTYKSTAQLADATASAAYNDTRERLMATWASDCESDDDLSLDEVLEIWGYESIIAGEMFVVKLYDGSLQIIPSELCGSEKCGLVEAGTTFADGTPVPAGTREKDGLLRLNRRVIGYRFAQRDPDTGAVEFTPEKSTIVRRDYVHHLYDRDRCEQGRGVPKTAPILAKLQDLFETGDARSQQVKNAACLSMWITKNMDPYGFAESMKGAMRTGQVQDAVALKTLAEQRSQYTELRAGAVYVGAVNEDVKLIEPKLGASDWHEHYIDLAQICCAVLDGMPVEVAFEGFRASNYSGSRATMNKWKRNVRRVRTRREQKLLNPLQLWQTRRFELFGQLDAIEQTQREECHWGWPAIPDIDGTKTAAMNAMELSNGSTTLEIICADKGLHADQVIKQRVAEKISYIKQLAAQAERELGLKPDKALAWAMTAAPDSDNPALSAILADAFIAPEAGAPAKK